MKSNWKSAMVGFAVGLGLAAAGAQAAVQAAEGEHAAPSAQKPAANAMTGMDKMKDMHAMMADPAMRQEMMANMGQCRDMMSMMMEHMKAMEQERGAAGNKAAPPKH